MKKTIMSMLALALAVLLAFSFSACKKSGSSGGNSEQENTFVNNPKTEYESLKKAADAAGFTILIPVTLKPTNIYVIEAQNKILEVNFEGGYLRKAFGDEDISGDYNEYAEQKSVEDDALSNLVLRFLEEDQVALATWQQNGCTYCIGWDAPVSETDALLLISQIA